MTIRSQHRSVELDSSRRFELDDTHQDVGDRQLEPLGSLVDRDHTCLRHEAE